MKEAFEEYGAVIIEILIALVMLGYLISFSGMTTEKAEKTFGASVNEASQDNDYGAPTMADVANDVADILVPEKTGE